MELKYLEPKLKMIQISVDNHTNLSILKAKLRLSNFNQVITELLNQTKLNDEVQNINRKSE
jgi:hypothetical protein